jgi:hypothetical protein
VPSPKRGSGAISPSGSCRAFRQPNEVCGFMRLTGWLGGIAPNLAMKVAVPQG